MQRVLEKEPSSNDKIQIRQQAKDDVRFFIQNNVETGCLKIAYDTLVEKLKLN